MQIFVITTYNTVVLLYGSGWSTEAPENRTFTINFIELIFNSIQNEIYCSCLIIMKNIIAYAEEPMAVCEPEIVCRKSSSMSSTLANSDLEERSFSSNSFMRLLKSIVLRVILRPGRPIRKIHGSHCRKTDLI